MLNLYKTNKIEIITDVIANELFINTPSITEEVHIGVNNYYLRKWMRDQITFKNQISALYKLETITNHNENILKKFFPKESFTQWDFESIKWRIINNFDELNTFKESKPLTKWLNQFKQNSNTLNKDIYILCSKIAKIFTDYLLYRPELIKSWHDNDLDNKSLFKGLNEDQYWQPILYKLIERSVEEQPTSLLMIEFINNNLIRNNIVKYLPNQFYIVSINNLSKLQVNFYVKLAEYIDINMYILSPGNDLWNRINTEEGIVNFTEKKYYEKENKETIEKIFGSFGARFENLIDENISEHNLKLNSYFPYFDPTVSKNNEKKVTLLKQVQKQIIENNYKNKILIKENDESLVLRASLNYLDQLRFIKNKIQEIIDSDKDISFTDIAIVSPQIEKIKPYLKYVFNSDFKIPYFSLFEDYREISGIYNFLLEIIDISKKRISFDEINSLLSNRIAQDIFNFDDKEREEILLILKDSGFHWGLDSLERFGDFKNTLEWTIQRITLGLLYDEDFFIKEKSLKSYIPKNSSLDLNKWVCLLSKIKEYINLFRSKNSFLNWLKIIRKILTDLNNKNYLFIDEIKNITEILNKYSESVNTKTNFDINVLQEIFNLCFSNRKRNPDKRRNEILISDMEKVRLIPHKIIFLMDMNENCYPRKVTKENINLLNKSFRIGDPSVRDKDLYMFLELLISCREKLIITWSEIDDKKHNQEISMPIRKFNKILVNDFNYEDIGRLNNISELKGLLNSETIANKNYISKNINELNWEEKIFDDKNYRLTELKNWFISPQLYWLNKKNIFPNNFFSHNADDETVSNFEKFKLFNNIFKENSIDDPKIIEKLNQLNIKEKIISNGIIAPNNSMEFKEGELIELNKSLVEKLKPLKKIERIYIKKGSNKEEYFLFENKIVEIIHSNLNLAKRSEIWIRLLFISSINNNITKALIIYRKNNEYKTESLSLRGNIKSSILLDQYIFIYKNCSDNFLPIPPESSYQYIKAKTNNKNPEKSFSDSWLGTSQYIKGERQKPEMELCFGYDVKPSLFLNNKNFDSLAMKIYSSLIKANEK